MLDERTGETNPATNTKRVASTEATRFFAREFKARVPNNLRCVGLGLLARLIATLVVAGTGIVAAPLIGAALVVTVFWSTVFRIAVFRIAVL